MCCKSKLADDIAQVSATLVAALDEVDALDRLSSLLEVADLMTDVEHSALLMDLYLMEKNQHLGQLRHCVEEARNLLTVNKKIIQLIASCLTKAG